MLIPKYISRRQRKNKGLGSLSPKVEVSFGFELEDKLLTIYSSIMSAELKQILERTLIGPYLKKCVSILKSADAENGYWEDAKSANSGDHDALDVLQKAKLVVASGQDTVEGFGYKSRLIKYSTTSKGSMLLKKINKET
jgi:hypothetical protein